MFKVLKIMFEILKIVLEVLKIMFFLNFEGNV
jgi:hypothetical protein